MSLPFQVDGANVWDPALGVGTMSVALAGAAADVEALRQAYGSSLILVEVTIVEPEPGR
jgi:hypothetical protein